MSEYIYYSIIATPIIHIADDEIAPHFKRLKEISDNVNSIAIRANQTANAYTEDLQEIKKSLAEIQNKLAEYQAKLERLAVTLKTFRAIMDKAHREAKK